MTKMELSPRALLVEDEPQLAQAIKISLKRMGIPADHASTLAQARERMASGAQGMPELVLLDRRLPDGDGLDFCRWLREQGYDGSILVLTASGATEDRVLGLNAGADDYLPKPFAWDELAARVTALGRQRSRFKAAKPMANALWSADEGLLRIRGPKGWEQLTPLEFKLATKIMGAGGAIVTRDELLKDVWGFKWLPQTRTVDYFLGRLRKRFEENPTAPRHFLTVRGAGYRFVA